jgi:hypothetical protein
MANVCIVVKRFQRKDRTQRCFYQSACKLIAGLSCCNVIWRPPYIWRTHAGSAGLVGGRDEVHVKDPIGWR